MLRSPRNKSTIIIHRPIGRFFVTLTQFFAIIQKTKGKKYANNNTPYDGGRSMELYSGTTRGVSP